MFKQRETQLNIMTKITFFILRIILRIHKVD